ncbi:PTS IIA-like nitrogen-regulatory protein PtsN [Polymorphobacter multimanifer]|uniref:PTS system nitrogen regulatory IIA component n=1 Tax=Polymorphobacter multimanifer TaxID=1070431 RepID=A0A841L3H7_9SPHN|nr:PTS sugar transporter subunit IIA [Polymorphobacter multimanifer]MBB6227389.1 PTS system nitrogen regulatory IIA component [Polymorphobacter multimanifer]GGI89242.1 PTS IIA-like nitrogen-regulatory protein PtsN [Polymorphobacter multimanifer]
MSGGDFADLLRGDAIFLGVEAGDKSALLAACAQAAAPLAGLPASFILERVRERETLGTTGFGQGVAIPHARLAGLDAVTIVVVRPAKPLDYGALDGEPVDLVVMLLSPEGAGADHLKALARISRALRNRRILAAMRAAPSADALFAAIDSPAMSENQAA